jgi:hypothetical protein
VLEETRILLLDLLVEVDDAVLGDAGVSVGEGCRADPIPTRAEVDTAIDALAERVASGPMPPGRGSFPVAGCGRPRGCQPPSGGASLDTARFPGARFACP